MQIPFFSFKSNRKCYGGLEMILERSEVLYKYLHYIFVASLYLYFVCKNFNFLCSARLVF